MAGKSENELQRLSFHATLFEVFCGEKCQNCRFHNSHKPELSLSSFNKMGIGLTAEWKYTSNIQFLLHQLISIYDQLECQRHQPVLCTEAAHIDTCYTSTIKFWKH